MPSVQNAQQFVRILHISSLKYLNRHSSGAKTRWHGAQTWNHTSTIAPVFRRRLGTSAVPTVFLTTA